MTEYVGAADAGVDLPMLRRVAPPVRVMDGHTATATTSGPALESMSDAAAARPDWRRWYRRRAVSLDLGVAILGSAVISGIALGLGVRPGVALSAAGLILAWVALLAHAGAYATRHIGDGTEEYRAIGRAGVHLFAVVAAVFFVTGLAPGGSRSLAPLILVLPVCSAVTRKVLRTVHVGRRTHGQHLQRTVVVGHWGSVDELVDTIRKDPVGTGLDIVAVCTDLPEGADGSRFVDLPVHGGPTTALQAASEYDADVVAIASHPDLVGHSMRRLSWALEARGIDLIVAPGIVEVAGPRLSLRPTAGLPMLHVERPLSNIAGYRLKCAFERFVAALAVVLLLPVAAVIATAIRLDSTGPVFFTQWRIGAGGEMFRMIKFRSMGTDAEKAKAALAGGNEVNAVMFKLKNDPRVTRVGAFLRKYSLDELPQLLNVVKGEMSLIGPRPPLPDEVATYESDAFRRLRLLPGMTGLWQVNGRSELSWDDSLRLDLWYVDNWSLTVDAQILVRTVRAVFAGKGAY